MTFQITRHKLTNRYFPILYVGIGSFIIYALFAEWGYDDPYITYRYAENIVSGHGFVYNIGEKVLSTTSPLFTILLAFLKLIWTDTHRTAVLLGALSLASGGLFIWKLGNLWGKPGISWTGLLFYPFFPLLLQTLSSETPLFLTFGLATFYFYFQKRITTSFTFGALALLTRPEGAIILVVLVGHHLIVHKTLPLVPLTIAAIIITPWLIYAMINFGSPIPVTLAAKQHQGSLAISEKFLGRIITILNWGYAQRWNYWIGFILALVGVLNLRTAHRNLVIFLLWPTLHLIALSMLSVSGYFWYYATLVPAYLVTAGNGIEVLHNAFPAWFRARRSYLQTTWVIIAILVATPMISHIVNLKQNPDQRLRFYRSIGEWIEDNTKPEASIGVLEVGIIGYYGDRRMIDFSGLIQPSIAEHLTPLTSYEEAALWGIKTFNPDYLIIPPAWATQFSDENGFSNCRSMHQFMGNEYSYGGDLILYQCD